MKRADLVAFMRRHAIAVEATVSPAQVPQAAVVGIVVTEKAEVFFDTLDTTRKLQNLRKHAKIALVIGWDEERTLQFEGIADEPRGDELAELKELYFGRYPDGRERERWPGITYVRVRPVWVRFSDFRAQPPEIIEFDGAQLAE